MVKGPSSPRGITTRQMMYRSGGDWEGCWWWGSWLRDGHEQWAPHRRGQSSCLRSCFAANCLPRLQRSLLRGRLAVFCVLRALRGIPYAFRHPILSQDPRMAMMLRLLASKGQAHGGLCAVVAGLLRPNHIPPLLSSSIVCRHGLPGTDPNDE